MATNQLFIPERINVGFQERGDTYTKKLAYVIYYDLKGVLRKEKSWQSWRNQKIKNKEFTNEPTEGFVLNKGVGGQRQSYGWNARSEYIRVYDPRDFEFEISVANLLFILRECDCSKGKGLEGKFVYAWQGTELILLPVISEDYQNSAKYTKLQDQNIAAKELILGASYTTKKQEVLTYVGRLDRHENVPDSYYYKSSPHISKQHVFWDGKNFQFMKNLKTLAVLNSDTVDPNYAELVDKYAKSKYGSKIAKLFTRKAAQKKENDYWVVETQPGLFTTYRAGESWRRRNYEAIATMENRVSVVNGRLSVSQQHKELFKDGEDWMPSNGLKLWATLESGSEYPIISPGYYSIAISDTEDNRVDDDEEDEIEEELTTTEEGESTNG